MPINVTPVSVAVAARRALLYVPGSSRKMLEKSRHLTLDTVAYDLEDSVTLGRKAEARANICSLLAQERPSGIKERAVRINAVGSGLEEADLAAISRMPYLDTIILPKVNSASDLRWVSDILTHARREPHSAQRAPVKILALIESARAVVDLSAICKATPRLSGLIFAAEDFALDLSLTRTPSLTEFLYARSAVVTAARAHDLPSAIDLVCTSLGGDEGRETMRQECIGGKNLGFNGKQCIHPDQVEIAHEAFGPIAEECEWAIKVLAAGEKAEQEGRGAWSLDGKMIDAPVLGKAKRILERAEACGYKFTTQDESGIP